MFDDARRAARSPYAPEHHRARLDGLVSTEWRLLYAALGILALGGLLDLVGAI